MAKISSRGREVAEYIRDRKPFKTYGALQAESFGPRPGYGYISSGRLQGADLDKFREDRDDITYVVWSYATPIAWETYDGRTHKVAQRFSVTTSKHQGQLYLF